MSNPTKLIQDNVKYDAEGYKVFDVNRYCKVDVSRTVFSNKTKRQEKYSDIQYLFDGDEFKNLFTSVGDVEHIYMQCQIAQHCRWIAEEVPEESSSEFVYAECLKAILEFEQNNKKYPGYDEKFKMPTPEDIEQMKRELGIKNEG
jgi:hypothetical protein